MKRSDFIKMCGIFGITMPIQAGLGACEKVEDQATPFTGRVIIIGAGAGGLAAGYYLHQRGIDFTILEASDRHGGRLRTNTSFADFPIPLGAEWLHTNPSIFQEVVNDAAVQVDIATVGYDRQKDTVGHWNGSRLTVDELIDSDRKFVGSTWFDFFEQYIIPPIKENILYNAVVRSVDYSGDLINVQLNNEKFLADKVIVAIPLKILQEGDIRFLPPWPTKKLEDIQNASIWDGFKAFFEFSKRFYHTATSFDTGSERDGQKLYYDASYGQDSEMNILGLFVVGKPAQPYLSRSGIELRDYILAELDTIYDNAATPNYIDHLTQNWNEEPFIRGAYLVDHENWRLVRRLSEPIADKIFFAGGAFTEGEDWVSVENAAMSARRAVEALTAG